jgi:preprotein translocase subunit SecD
MINIGKRWLFWFILLLVALSAFIDLPKEYPIKINLPFWQFEHTISSPKINFKLGSWSFYRDLNVKQGLDIQGGVHLVLEADMTNITEAERNNALESVRNVIERRVDLFGVTEPSIQTAKSEDKYRLIVDLPGIQAIDDAISLIGKTAQLDFRELPEEMQATDAASIWQFEQTGLTGKDLKSSNLDYSSETGEPVVALHFNDEGAEKFKNITTRNVNKQVAIFLDDIPLTAPFVNEPILTGEAVISGDFDVKNAKSLAIQLNAGALPAPISIVQQKNIGATLGEQSVANSIQAGSIGLVLVMLFMWLLYGRLGFIANMALVIYGLITLALYKLIPVTLTLPGLAGFILSVGMAVDSNILIFERMKEEERMGKPASIAMELGFGRAWESIKDANVCTLITCFVLFNPFNWSFLNTSGMIRGFALTLFLGIIISLFTGIVVTRTFIRLFYKTKE